MIRVLRLLEYTYEDFETAEEDMAKWQIPQIGVIHVKGRGSIRSTVMPPMTTEDDIRRLESQIEELQQELSDTVKFGPADE